MKPIIPTTFLALLIGAIPAQSGVIITGIYDAPLTGGQPKGVELYVDSSTDLSTWAIENYNNGGTSVTNTASLATLGTVAGGTFIYVTSDDGTEFQSFFGMAADLTSASALNVNGDDTVTLTNSGTIVDLYGVVGTDGTGTNWDHVDGWAYRMDGDGPNATFTEAEWTFSGTDVFDGTVTNDTAGTPFPKGTYAATAVPEPSTGMLVALAALALGLRRPRR